MIWKLYENRYEICNKWKSDIELFWNVGICICLIKWLRFSIADFRVISLIGVDNCDYLLKKTWTVTVGWLFVTVVKYVL